MTWNEFYKSVKDGRFERVYCFTGPEAYNKREALAALRRACLPAGLEELNEMTLEGVSAQDIIDMQGLVGTVYCSKEVRHYIASIAAMTRNHPSLQLGVSTRGAIALIRGAQACALLNDRDYVLPEDVQRMVLPVLTHRIMPNPDAKMKGISAERILIAVVENVPVPLRLS